MPIRDRVARLMAGLPAEPQFPTQGATAFVDLERREVRRAYTPIRVVRSLLSGRGANMFYLYRLLDESLEPLHPDIPLIFGSGVAHAAKSTSTLLRRPHRHRPQRGARQRHVVVARNGRPDGHERRRLLPVVHEDERL